MNTSKLKRYILKRLKNGLSPQLKYHGIHHTILVIAVCEKYIKRLRIPPPDARLIRTAALLHDTGFLFGYDNHEAASVNFARKILPAWNYSSQEIEKVAGMILATKIPQMPTNLPEQILSDADLDYLGTDAFESIGTLLFEELVAFGKIKNENEWNELQINFIQRHRYQTSFAIKHREPAKLAHLKRLKEKLQ
jgi:predicted metal-dependent HD superfamily phosphohydrolase